MVNKIQFKRGLKANLPNSADVGMPLWCTDTKELYMGTGNGVIKVGGLENGSEVDYSVFALSSDLSAVATSGSYNDLLNKPTIPTVPTNISAFTNDSGYLTQHQDISGKANSSDLSEVATSGNYNDLLNKPTIPTIPTNVSAFTNDAGYLTQHQDISGKANSSDLSEVATSGNYNDLLNKPTIPTVPTNVSAFTNDAGYLTQHQSLASKEDVHKPTYNRSNITTLSLDTNKIYVCTASDTSVAFYLPSLDVTQRTKFNQILVQLYMGTVVPVDLGTTLFFNKETPDMSSAGYYDIVYEYDYTIGYWACGVLAKGSAQ